MIERWRFARGWSCALAVVLLHGCRGPSPVTHSITFDTLDSGGVFVHNRGPGIWDDAARWRLVEDLRIGRVDGQSEYVFGIVADVIADGYGRIWVLDRQAAEVRVFDAEGGYLRTIGGRGNGPGEFELPIHLVQSPEGDVWITDIRNNRVEVFDSAGGHLASHRRPPQEFSDAIVFDSTGMLLYRVRSVDRLRTAHFVVRADPEGLGPLDTFPEVAPLGVPVRFSTQPAAGGAVARVVRPVPYAHQPGFRLVMGVSQYLAWPGGGTYRFGALTLHGDTLLMTGREYEPVPIPDSILQREFGRIGDDGDPARDTIPGFYPPFEQVHRAPTGYWWVTRRVGPDSIAIEVFANGGAFLGDVSSSSDLARFELMYLTPDAVYGVDRDELDVPYIVRLRVVRPPDTADSS